MKSLEVEDARRLRPSIRSCWRHRDRIYREHLSLPLDF